MTPERWQQIKKVLDVALSLDTDEREQYLDSACASDLELRREVESLLSVQTPVGASFMDTPVVDFSNLPAETGHATIRTGRPIGVYTIIKEIGHGGMGEVYSAARTDGQYEKNVAIKLVRAGFDTASALERFRNERQILASLDHPNIARLLDGGATSEGLPFLVMELIEGTPIDEYCDQHSLSRHRAPQTLLHRLRRNSVRASKPGHSSRLETKQHPRHERWRAEAARFWHC